MEVVFAGFPPSTMMEVPPALGVLDEIHRLLAFLGQRIEGDGDIDTVRTRCGGLGR
jgi:hypothetical protein